MEYWIDNDGTEIYCDGDAGFDVPNHAMAIVSRCGQLLLDALQTVDTLFGREAWSLIEHHLLDDVIDCTALRCDLNDSLDSWIEEGIIDQKAIRDIYKHLSKICKLDPEIIYTAFGQTEDPRDLGVKWGWVRVVDHNFMVQKLTKDACHRMYEFAFEHDAGKEWTVEIVEHGGRRKYIMGIPLADLESPKAVLRHLRQTSISD